VLSRTLLLFPEEKDCQECVLSGFDSIRASRYIWWNYKDYMNEDETKKNDDINKSVIGNVFTNFVQRLCPIFLS